MVRASKSANVEDPRLDDHASDAGLQLLKHMLMSDRKDGVVARGAPRIAPRIHTEHQTKVVLQDCIDGRHWLLYGRDGKVLNNDSGGRYAADATVELHGSDWKVTKLYWGKAGSC